MDSGDGSRKERRLESKGTCAGWCGCRSGTLPPLRVRFPPFREEESRVQVPARRTCTAAMVPRGHVGGRSRGVLEKHASVSVGSSTGRAA